MNSGSEANDVALLMARLYSGNYDVLALRNCYHGMSDATMGMTSHHTWKFPVPQARPTLSSAQAICAYLLARHVSEGSAGMFPAEERWGAHCCV